MKELGMLFTADMVRAILAGRKTQTRRVPTIHNAYCTTEKWRNLDWREVYAMQIGHAPETAFMGFEVRALIEPDTLHRVWPRVDAGDLIWGRYTHWRGCKGLDNDQVWDECSRTTRWRNGRTVEDHDLALDDKGHHVMMRRTPSIFMPRWASRLILRLTRVRAEFLHDITPEDAIAEGVHDDVDSAVADYAALWDRINGKKYPWASNPPVLVFEWSPLKGDQHV